MNPHLYMAEDKVFTSLSSLKNLKDDLSDEELLTEFGQKNVTIVLRDPTFVSEASTVSLGRRSDRHKMAAAKFQVLAGDVGFGSWYIAQHLGERRLFAWAIDSGSLEAIRLRKMIDYGVQIEKISSQTLLLPMPLASIKSEAFIRVHCTEQSTQLALMLEGQWIFTRRVDISSASPLEAFKSTLVHLRSQSYLSDSTDLSWQLIASDETKEKMSPLWLGEGADIPMPNSSSRFNGRDLYLDYFNSIGATRRGLFPKYLSIIRPVSSAVILLLITYLMPAVFLSTDALRRINGIKAEIEPESMSQRFWKINILKSQKINTMEDVSDLLQRLLALTVRDEELELMSFSTDSQQRINLRFQLKKEILDPVNRLQLQTKLRSRLETLIPTYQVIDLKGNQLAVGEAQKKSSFEMVLEVRHDEG